MIHKTFLVYLVALILIAAPVAHAAWVMTIQENDNCPDGFVSTIVKSGNGNIAACVPAEDVQEQGTPTPAPSQKQPGPLEGPHLDGA